jgi:hypothetical protein
MVDSFEERKRKFREEEEAAQAKKKAEQIKGVRQTDLSAPPPTAIVGDADKIMASIHEAEVMIERLNNLYNQFFTGIEKRPPIEPRSKLENLMMSLAQSAKATPQVKFRYQTLLSRFSVHKDRWERLMKQKSG